MQLQLRASNYKSYLELMRVEKPIGIYLLLWPTLWALWIASFGVPYLHYLIVFGLGVFLMRSAGCVINDFADRKIDGHVERTATRPIPAGRATASEAIQLFVVLIALAFLLVLTLDWQVIVLSTVGLALAFCYPFMKRFTHFPQVVLGAAFSWSIPMAFMAVQADLPIEVWVLYFANLCWTVAYDTLYAMVDKEDDLKVGVKSTAIAFGKNDLFIVALLQLSFLWLFVQLFHYLNWQSPMLVAISICAALFLKQLWQCRERDREKCFKAFLDNHYIGLVIFVGLVIQYAVY